MGNNATKEAQAGNIIHQASSEAHHAQYITSPPVSPARVASLQEEVLDPRSPGALKRTPVHSPQLGGKPSSTYKERVLNRFMQQSSPMDPRSPAALRTPLSKIGIAVVRTPPPINLSVGDPRSPFMMRTPLHLTQETVFLDDDVVVCDGAEVAEEEVVVKQDQVEKEAAPSTSQNEFKTSSPSVVMSPSPLIMALSASSPLDSPSLNRKRKATSRRQTMSPLKKSFSAPMPDENTPQNMKSSTATTPTLTPTPASAMSSKPRTPLSPLTNTRAANSHNCGPIQPIKFRMDPGILG